MCALNFSVFMISATLLLSASPAGASGLPTPSSPDNSARSVSLGSKLWETALHYLEDDLDLLALFCGAALFVAVTKVPRVATGPRSEKGKTRYVSPQPPLESKLPAEQTDRRVVSTRPAVRSTPRPMDVDSIVPTLEGMDEVDECFLSWVLEAGIRAQRSDVVSKVLERYRQDEKVAVSSPQAYGSVIRAYGSIKNIARAEEVWSEMRGRNILPTSVTLGCMVEAVCCNGDPERGHRIIREMLHGTESRPLVNAITYGSVLKGFSHQEQFGNVWSVYQEMIAEGLQSQMSIVTYNTLIDACARCGKMTHAPELLEVMTAQGIEPNLVTYSTVIKGFCLANRVDEAFDLLDTMKQATHLRLDDHAYNILLDGCSRQRFHARGLKLFEDMKKSGVCPTNYTLSVLVKLISRCGTVDEAFAACESTSKQYNFELNHHVYANLVQACVKDNRQDLDRAIGVVVSMVERGVKPDARVYKLLLRACVEAGRPGDADGLLRAATGLSGVHRRFEKLDSRVLQPRGGLPGDMISEVLRDLPQCRGGGDVAARLFKGLRLSKPSLKLDPQLWTKFAAADRKASTVEVSRREVRRVDRVAVRPERAYGYGGRFAALEASDA